jgi:hypothetical protein
MSGESGVRAADLHGHIAGQAFKEFVVRDRAVQSYREVAIQSNDRWSLFFADGCIPGLHPTTLWPLRITADSLAEGSVVPDQWAWLAAINSGQRLLKSEPSDAVRELCGEIADRANRFFGFLSAGELIATDIDNRVLGRSAWLGADLRLDVQTSNLCAFGNKEPLARVLLLGRVSSSVSPIGSKNAGKSGRPYKLDWAALKGPLRNKVKRDGPFASDSALTMWCIDNVKLRPGVTRPKGDPSTKNARLQIRKHGLDKIGLSDSTSSSSQLEQLIRPD